MFQGGLNPVVLAPFSTVLSAIKSSVPSGKEMATAVLYCPLSVQENEWKVPLDTHQEEMKISMQAPREPQARYGCPRLSTDKGTSVSPEAIAERGSS